MALENRPLILTFLVLNPKLSCLLMRNEVYRSTRRYVTSFQFEILKTYFITPCLVLIPKLISSVGNNIHIYLIFDLTFFEYYFIKNTNIHIIS